jgi:cobalt/nickel transport system permease protein
MLHLLPPIFAVHISDGYLSRPWQGWPWLVGGYAVAALLCYWGTRRIRDEEIPRIALLTAAFTVASGLHINFGPVSVHLILNGLLGAVLGRRAALAIPVGLFLQALAGHGGFTTLGINSCVMLTPALLAGWVLRRPIILTWSRRPLPRSALAAVSAIAWAICAVAGVALMVRGTVVFHSWDELYLWAAPLAVPALGVAVVAAVAAVVIERWLNPSAGFSLAYLVGQSAVLLSVALSTLVMLLGGPDNEGAYLYGLISFVAHLPLAMMEGFVLGFLYAYLLRVRPDMLQEPETDAVIEVPALVAEPGGSEECSADTVS